MVIMEKKMESIIMALGFRVEGNLLIPEKIAAGLLEEDT